MGLSQVLKEPASAAASWIGPRSHPVLSCTAQLNAACHSTEPHSSKANVPPSAGFHASAGR